jgi:DnaK suppressor protein
MDAEIDINYFKNKLNQELKILDAELQRVAQKNPSNSNDWQVKPADVEEETSDFRDEVAGQIEEMDEKVEIEANLESRWRHVKSALAKIERGAYGLCEIGNEPIELERLEANPAARTCKQHLPEDANLP